MAERWWGEIEVPENETRHWRIGPFDLWMRHSLEEWQASFERCPDPFVDDLVVAAEPSREPAPEATTRRFGFRRRSSLVLRPLTADRPVIVRSEKPFWVPAGEEVQIFVSVPLWVGLRSPSDETLVLDEPVSRLSDTWFGPSTLVGELCYAVKTSIRFHRENLPDRPHRVVSAVRIRNHCGTPLPLERIRIPAPNLSLYASESGHLWTEAVTLEREEDGNLAALKLGRGAPREAGTCRKVGGPREVATRGVLHRTFGSLLGMKGGNELERVVE